MLYERMEVLLQNDPDNTTLINGTAFREVVQEVFITNATPALWFYAAGVSTCTQLLFATPDAFLWRMLTCLFRSGKHSRLPGVPELHQAVASR